MVSSTSPNQSEPGQSLDLAVEQPGPGAVALPVERTCISVRLDHEGRRGADQPAGPPDRVLAELLALSVCASIGALTMAVVCRRANVSPGTTVAVSGTAALGAFAVGARFVALRTSGPPAEPTSC